MRPTYTTNNIGERVSTTANVDVDIWLFDPNERNIQNDFGERLDGDLGGLCLPDESVQVNDSVATGGHEYVVDSIIPLPNENDTKYLALNFRRITDAA